MDANEHLQVFYIIKKYNETFTRTQNGILISTDNLNDECLEEIDKYVTFSMDQRTRMEADMKTRKTYERMLHD